MASLTSLNDQLHAANDTLRQKVDADAETIAAMNRQITNLRLQLRRWSSVRDWYRSVRPDLVDIWRAQELLVRQMGGSPIFNGLSAIYRWCGPFPEDLGSTTHSWNAEFEGHPAWYYLPGSSRDGGIPSIYTEASLEWPKWFYVWKDPEGEEHVSGIGSVAVYGAYTYEYGTSAYHLVKHWATRLDQIWRFAGTCLQASFSSPPVIPRLRRSSL